MSFNDDHLNSTPLATTLETDSYLVRKACGTAWEKPCKSHLENGKHARTAGAHVLLVPMGLSACGIQAHVVVTSPLFRWVLDLSLVLEKLTFSLEWFLSKRNHFLSLLPLPKILQINLVLLHCSFIPEIPLCKEDKDPKTLVRLGKIFPSCKKQFLAPAWVCGSRRNWVVGINSRAEKTKRTSGVAWQPTGQRSGPWCAGHHWRLYHS